MRLSSLKDSWEEIHSRMDLAHDFTHIERIVTLCKIIAPPETDIKLVIEAAYLHSLLREETKIQSFLKSLGFEDGRIERIMRTVRGARPVAKPQTVEEKVLHDANILDGLGAIGIARAFTKGGYEHQTLNETTEIMKKNMERRLYTPRAKQIGQRRKHFMQRFLKRLEREL